MSSAATSRTRWRSGLLVVAVLVVALGAGGCADESASADTGSLAPPASLVEVEGREVPRLVLTERAVERLGIAFAPVTASDAGSVAVPYAAVVYTSDGKAWAYTSPERHVFERTAIEVTAIEDDVAILAAGPPVGTEVVVLGGAELGGVEEGL